MPKPETSQSILGGCRGRGCGAPIAGIARLCREPRNGEPTYKGRVWGGWEYYCREHLDELSRDQYRVAYVDA